MKQNIQKSEVQSYIITLYITLEVFNAVQNWTESVRDEKLVEIRTIMQKEYPYPRIELELRS